MALLSIVSCYLVTKKWLYFVYKGSYFLIVLIFS